MGHILFTKALVQGVEVLALAWVAIALILAGFIMAIIGYVSKGKE